MSTAMVASRPPRPVALLALRGSIHATMRLRPDAYALAADQDVVLTAEAMVLAFVAMSKPLRGSATVSHGAVTVHLTAWRERSVIPSWDVMGGQATGRSPRGGPGVVRRTR